MCDMLSKRYAKPYPNNRLKCAGISKKAEVQDRYIKLPIDVKKTKNGQEYEDLKGLEIQNYSSLEAIL